MEMSETDVKTEAGSTLSVMCGTLTEHSLVKVEITSGKYNSVINRGL